MSDEGKVTIFPPIMVTILQGTVTGAIMMIGISPFVNFFNNVSVVGTKYNLTWGHPYLKVYQGVEGAPSNSFTNCFRGISAHYFKEGPRLLFKPFGLFVLKPHLDNYFTPWQSSLLFAGSLSVAEMGIANPPDTLRVLRQAGKKINYSWKTLYKGSLANGGRQFYTWWSFSELNHYLNKIIVAHNGSPDTGINIFFKSWIIGGGIAAVFPLEKVKNELQYSAALGNTKSSYIETAKRIVRTQGWSAFFHGVGPKYCSNTLQVGAAITLVNLGKKKLQPIQKQPQEEMVSSSFKIR